MKLPIPHLFEKKQKNDYFLTLLLQDEKASAVIIESDEGKVKIIGRHEEPFVNSLEKDSEEEFLSVLDKAISRAEETLPADKETEKTIFGVKHSWIEEKKIKKEYLSKLKVVCDELTLSPLGFLVISEAIAHLIQQEEGNPVSAIIAELGQKITTASLFRGGRLIEVHSRSTSSEETDSPVHTVDLLLKEFQRVEVLPSRIILFSDRKDDEQLQQFISHQWSKSLPFLHVPQIAVLPHGFAAKAVVCGAASQLGLEVIGTIIDQTTHDVQLLTRDENLSSRHEKKHDKEESESVEKVTEKNKDDEESHADSSDTDFGFILDEDIALVPREKLEKTKEKKDADMHHTTVAAHENSSLASRLHDEVDDDNNFDEEEDEDNERPSFFTGLISRLSLPKFSFGTLLNRNMYKNRLLIIPPVIILLCIGILLLYTFNLKANIALTVQPKNINQVQNITFSTISSNDFSTNTIAAKNSEIELSTKISGNATGKKDTGNKAKGNVTIYNNTETKKQLPAGTTITFNANIEFVLDKEISVASASGDEFSGTKPGTANVGVTAKNIGTEYNLPSGSKFTVTSFNGVAAKNDNAFSGGSKKEVTIVAKKDTDTLEDKLTEELKEKAKSELVKKIKSNERLIVDSIAGEVTKKTFDNEIGEEAKTVTLTGTVRYTALVYTSDDVLSFAQSLLKNKFSQDTTIPEESITTTFTDTAADNDTEVSSKMTIKAHLLPKIDTKKVAASITGKSYTEAASYLQELPQVANASITLQPNISFLPHILPQQANNITVTMNEK